MTNDSNMTNIKHVLKAWTTNNELQYYASKRKENTRVEKGHLIIEAKAEEKDGRHFTSARLTSKKAWTYGKFECRARLPKGKHLWPAIWLMPQNNEFGKWFVLVLIRGSPRPSVGSVEGWVLKV